MTSVWTIDPAGLHSRNNYSCFAVNSGGNGSIATINVDLHVAPAMIRTLPPYTGYLFSEPNINLSCRVECVPSCSIYWHRDNQEISKDDQRYIIQQTNLPADSSTGDFESVFSELVNTPRKDSIIFFVNNINNYKHSDLQYICMAGTETGHKQRFR